MMSNPILASTQTQFEFFVQFITPMACAVLKKLFRHSIFFTKVLFISLVVCTSYLNNDVIPFDFSTYEEEYKFSERKNDDSKNVRAPLTFLVFHSQMVGAAVGASTGASTGAATGAMEGATALVADGTMWKKVNFNTKKNIVWLPKIMKMIGVPLDFPPPDVSADMMGRATFRITNRHDAPVATPSPIHAIMEIGMVDKITAGM